MSKSRWCRALVAVGALVVLLPSAAAAKPQASFEQLGHNPLLHRGMNAALAVHGKYAYIGSRTDEHAAAPHGGIMVVDVRKPRRPKLLGLPYDARPGESTRELRVWRAQDMLIVLNTNCGVGPTLHHCTQPSVSNIRFYDISGANARRPREIHRLDVDTHEFFLWVDPRNPERALIFGGNASSNPRCTTRGGSPTCPLSVWDISPLAQNPPGPPVTLYGGSHGYSHVPPSATQTEKPGGGLHSLSVTNDGSEAYYALLTGGFAVVDVSDFAARRPSPQPRPITANESRPTWPGPGSHSAVKLWKRDWAWVSDEVYGSATGSSHGCPWGWARLVNIAAPERPAVVGQYRLPANFEDNCDEWEPRPRTSYSAHNPTLTRRIAFSTWHSGGLQAANIVRPRAPYRLAEFYPEPLDRVLLEDPRLSSDPDTGRHEKVVMWSFPIIKDGLIYVVDLRNGLYVLRYRGRYAREVRRIHFLEGNSNQGDALCYEPVGKRPRHCRR